MATVAARGLTKRFGSTRAVDDVDLVVEEGEVSGLLGANGAGKTTLLRMLLGLVPPDDGTIELFGRTLGATEKPILDGVSGFVEDPSFYPYMSGRANLELLAVLDGDRSRARIDDALARVDLTSRAEDRVAGYSTGMRQRLGIAAALLRSPRLLLLDEPTSGMDPAGVRFVGELLSELSERGVAVLLSSHQISEIEGICDSFSVLERGRVVWQGSAEQMRADAPPSAYLVVTSDDSRALAIAGDELGVHAEPSSRGALRVRAREPALDSYVLALARAGVAVRRLELTASSLESMFFMLTDPPNHDRWTRSERSRTGGGHGP
ncbi:MAG TPA: ABC transporter ATP-binding protein [Solirubrobacteraceae bacterium]|nr:ABC transporter ATP-binding protein [Solirubrobacteraceae bacterium]